MNYVVEMTVTLFMIIDHQFKIIAFALRERIRLNTKRKSSNKVAGFDCEGVILGIELFVFIILKVIFR